MKTKTLVVIIVLFFCVMNPILAQKREMITWKFTGVWTEYFVKNNPTHPQSVYWAQIVSEKHDTSGCWLRYEEFKDIFSYFNVKDPSCLVDKWFIAPYYTCKPNKSKQNPARFAISYLTQMQKHSGKYIPPTFDELYEYIVKSFCDMKVPDFSNVDVETKEIFFENFFTEDDTLIEKIRKKVSEIDKEITFIETGRNSIPIRVQGPCRYCDLIKGSQKIRVWITPTGII